MISHYILFFDLPIKVSRNRRNGFNHELQFRKGLTWAFRHLS
jgi:hypothetical protein